MRINNTTHKRLCQDEFIVICYWRKREGEVIAIIPKAADIDGDVLTYSIRGLPERADYDFDSKTGVLNWRTTYEEAGEYDLNFAVDDGRN